MSLSQTIWLTPVASGLTLLVFLAYAWKRRCPASGLKASAERRELQRARKVVRELEQISKQIRSSLEAHNSSVAQFKDRLASLHRRQTADAWHVISDEAERILQPTLRLSGEIARAYEQIRQQTTLLMSFTDVRTDALTGLSNRRALDEALASWFAMKARYQTDFSMAILDIDYFKNVNDAHGHLYGDRMIQNVAQAINASIRETDLAARFGGEEFIVLMPETDLLGACVLCERIRTKIEESLPITISGGISLALNSDTPQTLLARADAALYAAKANGRNTLRIQTDSGLATLEECLGAWDRQHPDEARSRARTGHQPAATS